MSFYFARAFRTVKKTLGNVKQLKQESDNYIKKLQNNESLKNYNKNIDSNPFYWVYKAKVFAKDKVETIKKTNNDIKNSTNSTKSNINNINQSINKMQQNTNSKLENVSGRVNKVYRIFI